MWRQILFNTPTDKVMLGYIMNVVNPGVNVY